MGDSKRSFRIVGAMWVLAFLIVPLGIEGEKARAYAQTGPGTASRILSVQVQDQADQTVVRIRGDGGFRGYQLRKTDEDRFVLELPGIRSDASRASVPTRSKRLHRLYIDGTARSGVQLVGMLNVPLSRHSFSEAGDELVLSLYPAPVAQQPFPRDSRPKPPVKRSRPLPPAPEPVKQAAPEPILTDPRSEMVSTPRGGREEARQATVADDQEAIQAELEQVMSGMEKTYEGKLISLDLQGADLENVLRLIADVTGTNIVIEPGVSGTVSLKVDKIPWDQVMDMILAMNGLGMEWTGNIIRVAPKAKLKAEEDERKALVQARLNEIKERQEFLEQAQDFGEITTAYLYVSYAPVSDIAAKIEGIKSEKGTISTDARTKLVIFKDYPARIRTARELLDRLDRPTPQVLIEARLVQVDLSASHNLGITWLFDYDGRGVTTTNESDFIVNLPSTGAGAASSFGFGIGRMLGTTLWDLDLRIAAMEQTTAARVIASPRVVTLDGVAAKIEQGTRIATLTESESGGTTTEYVDATLNLSVTPSITPDDRVRMKIDVKQDSPVAGSTDINTRNVNTELLVQSENIVVIGGIIGEQTDEVQSKVPVLGDIPWVGKLFQSKSTRRQRSELLVFISPKIIQETEPRFARGKENF